MWSNGFFEEYSQISATFEVAEEIDLDNNATTLPKSKSKSSGGLSPFRRFMVRHPGWVISLFIMSVSVLYLSVTIGLDFVRFKQSSRSGFGDFGLFDWWVKERFVEILIYWWVVSFGASVGSFLNVVVYRMPLGMSLSAKSSHCVWCKAKIYSRDNLPIIGWLMLGGRCRKCRLPISGRYPLVEAQTAIMGLVMFIAMVQVRNYGLGPFAGDGVNWHFWLMNMAPVGQLILYFYLFWLLAFCVAVAWIDFDNNRLPIKLVISTVVASVVVPFAVLLLAKPYLERQFYSAVDLRFSSPLIPQVKKLIGIDETKWGSINVNLVDIATNQCSGMVAGLLAGLGIWFLFDSAFPHRQTVAAFSNDQQDGLTFDDTSSKNGLVSILIVFGVSGLFCGPVFALLFATVSFLTSVLATTLLMNSRLSPLRTRWFFLPYSFLISILTWRLAESIWIS